MVVVLSAQKAGRFTQISTAAGVGGVGIDAGGVHSRALSAISGQGGIQTYRRKDAARDEHGAAFHD